MGPLSDSRRAASRPRPPLRIVASTVVAVLFLLAACGESATETAPTNSVTTTTASSVTTTTTMATASTTTLSVTTAATTARVSDAQLEAAVAVGDIDAGEDLFFRSIDGIPDSASCSTCHSLDPSNSQYAPTLAGIWTTAAGRVDGLTSVDYLRQSIVDPYAFVVEGSWLFAMPYQYPDVLSDDEIDDLIAFLLTR